MTFSCRACQVDVHNHGDKYVAGHTLYTHAGAPTHLVLIADKKEGEFSDLRGVRPSSIVMSKDLHEKYAKVAASAVEKLDVEKLHALVNEQTNATLRVLDCSHALPPPPKGSSRRDDTEAAKRERCVRDAQSKLKCKIYTKLKAEQV